MTLRTLIHARSDGADHLVMADEPLAGLQARCGGLLPGPIAVPALLALVRRVRRTRQPAARTILSVEDGRLVSAWAVVTPEGDGTAIALSQWQLGEDEVGTNLSQDEALLRQMAVGTILLDAEQRVLAADIDAPELAVLAQALSEGPGRYWTDFIVTGRKTDLIADGRPPLHWRLLDDALFMIAGSDKKWRARILPRVRGGFEMLIIPEGVESLPIAEPTSSEAADEQSTEPGWNRLLGRDLAPALRQPITRIIANAETIRTRLAGPLSDEYAEYAKDIAEAGRHLMSLIEDLADLEAVEAPGFAPAPDHIDLADCARRAAGILSVRAQERGITLCTPDVAARVPAIGEFRRVLQVLLNLLSNAIRYSPEGSAVTLEVGAAPSGPWIAVRDEGAGLSAEQAERVFEKFERLGRSGDGGSGLGLYISRRLARAMGGDLTVASQPGESARFELRLPADTGA